jgi:hypothetical protein
MFATSVSPPLKEIDVLINAYALFYRKPLALVLSKYSTNSLHSPCLLPLPKRHIFHLNVTILPNVHFFFFFD